MALKTVEMPQLGESVTEGTIGQWLKQPGDAIEEYESLLEVTTDKVNAEVPSPATGVVKRLLVQEGETVPVGTAIAELEVEGEGEEEPEPAVTGPAETEASARPGAPQAAERPAPARREGVRYSPAVRKLAEEFGINPDDVPGTGAGGRVTRNDIRQFAEAGERRRPAGAPQPSAPAGEAAPAPAIAAGAPARVEDVDELVPVSQVRRVIAERMVRSKQTVPHAWLMVEADVSGLVALRERHKDTFRAREGVSLTD